MKRKLERKWSAKEKVKTVLDKRGKKLDKLLGLLMLLSENDNIAEIKCCAHNILQCLLTFDFLAFLEKSFII